MITGLKNLNVASRRYQNIDGGEALENQEESGLEDDELEEDDDEEEKDDPTEGDGGLEE